MNVNLLSASLLLPLAAGTVVLLIPSAVRWVRESIALLAMAFTFVIAVLILLHGGLELRIPLIRLGDFSLDVDLVATPLGSFLLVCAAGFGFLVCLSSLPYMAGKARLREYYAFLLFVVAGSACVLLADHLLLFLIGWEVVTVSLYFLVTTGGPEAREGATRAFVMLGAGDGCLLLGIGIFWFLQKTFSASGPRLPVDGWLPGLAFLLMLAGALAKAGGMPLHTWIPAASRGAPATVMALLPGAIDKLLGIYLIARLVTGVFALGSGMGMLLMILGSVTVIAAVMVAMVQHDLRRLLSYHAVSQVGYMVLGIGTLTPIGLVGGLFHMLNNAVYKSCLFLCAGAVEREAGSTDLDELGGLAKAMPGTFSAGLVAALAISGVPPLNGFVSKWLVYQGTIGSGSPVAFLFLVIVMFGSGLTLASFMKVIYAVFLGRMSERTRRVKHETSAAMLVPMAVLALLCVIFGIFYAFPLAFLVLPGVSTPLGFAGVWDSPRAAAFLAGGFVLGVLVLLAGRIGKTRRVPSFVGGEEVGARVSARVAASRFYDTIRSLPLLGRIYDAQERGAFDPHVQVGRVGAGLVGFLRRLHGGNLLWYLAWSLLGTGILLVLFVVVR